MAIRINLLPWREELKKKRTRLSFAFLIGGLLIGCVLSALAYWFFSDQEEKYNSAISYVQSETKKLDKELSDKKKLELLKEKLGNQIASIEELQGKRSNMTHAIEELSKSIPTDLFLSKFDLQDEVIIIEGVALNDNQISTFLLNLENSPWFAVPEISYINLDDNYPDETKVFKVVSKLISPETEGESDEK